MNTCPNPEMLRQLLDQQLDEDDFRALEGHLENCQRCREALDCLTGSAADILPPLAETPPAAPTTLPQLPGFEDLCELGRGGMGVVYRARQVGLKRLVALKLILAGSHARPDQSARFRAEAEAVARLQHPHIVQLHAIAEHEGRPYFVLEYVNGGSLAQQLAGTPQPPREAAQLVETVARAVHVAHQSGIIHRDLKPANILLALSPDPEGSAGPALPSGSGLNAAAPKITDFGLAKQLDAGVDQTHTGQVLGTPSYMAPEQGAGRGAEPGPATDVYGLGAILYEMLTGRPPFKGATALETLEQVRTQEPLPPTALQPKVPRDLETICLKCLHKEARGRYPSALELAEDLRRLLRHEPIQARRPSLLYRCRKFTQRNRVLVGGVAATVLVLVLGIVGVTWGLIWANEERGRAQTAEGDNRRLLAESYAQLAQLNLRQGDFSQALRNLDRALQAGHPEAARLRLEKVKAWYALNQTARANRELANLEGDPGLKGQQGTLWLWRGDVLLGSDNDQAVRYLRKALALGLPGPADRAYAEGLLAPTSQQAVAKFRKALALEPYHPRANHMLGITLFFLGRKEELHRCLAAAQAFFPKDANLRLLEAMLYAVEDNRKTADRILRACKASLGEKQVAAARLVVWLLRELQHLEDYFNLTPLEMVMRLMPRMMTEGLSLVPFGKEGPDGAALIKAIGFRLPPFLSQSFGRLQTAVRSAFKGDLCTANAELTEAVKGHPEGTLFLLQGQTFLAKGHFPEARTAFQKAVDAPALASVRNPALYYLVRIEWQMGGRARTQAAEHLRQFLSSGGLRPELAEKLTEIANDCGGLELARSVVVEWHRRVPRDDFMANFMYAGVERESGNYFAAIRRYQQLLKQSPNNPLLLERIKESQELLKKQFADLTAGR